MKLPVSSFRFSVGAAFAQLLARMRSLVTRSPAQNGAPEFRADAGLVSRENSPIAGGMPAQVHSICRQAVAAGEWEEEGDEDTEGRTPLGRR